MKRKFSSLSRKSLFAIANEYVNVAGHASPQYFAERFNISTATFYKALYKAVIISAVDETTVKNMCDLASANAFKKGDEPAKARVVAHYSDLMRQRKTYIPDRNECIEMVTRFARSNFQLMEYCSIEKITQNLMNKIICQVVVEKLISCEIFYKLYDKFIKYAEPTAAMISQWDEWKNLYR